MSVARLVTNMCRSSFWFKPCHGSHVMFVFEVFASPGLPGATSRKKVRPLDSIRIEGLLCKCPELKCNYDPRNDTCKGYEKIEMYSATQRQYTIA